MTNVEIILSIICIAEAAAIVIGYSRHSEIMSDARLSDAELRDLVRRTHDRMDVKTSMLRSVTQWSETLSDRLDSQSLQLQQLVKSYEELFRQVGKSENEDVKKLTADEAGELLANRAGGIYAKIAAAANLGETIIEVEGELGRGVFADLTSLGYVVNRVPIAGKHIWLISWTSKPK
jgi:methyl-accepting chemotaxis protein